MFTYKLFSGYQRALVSLVFTRYKGTGKGTATEKRTGTRTATDPVQQLFLDKIREYRSKRPDGSLLDPSPAILKEMKAEMDKLNKNYGGAKGVDMTAFPTFKFVEPKLDPIDEALPEQQKKKKKKPIRKTKKAAKRGPPDWIMPKKKKKKK